MNKPRYERAELDVLQTVPPLVELEPGLLLGPRFDWRNMGPRIGDWFGGRRLFRRLRGSGEHLDHLLEGRGVCLNEGCRVRIRFGSGNGFRSWRLLLVETIAVAATAAATVGAVAVWRWYQTWVLVLPFQEFR